MKTIVCFGDSNTWGVNPATDERHSRDHRWPLVLAQELGEGFDVIPEGQNGRTAVVEDPVGGPRVGRDYLVPCLESHKPVDLLIILLGTNELKHRHGLSAWDIAQDAGLLVGIAQSSSFGPEDRAPDVLLLAPPPIGKLSGFAEMFAGATEKSRELGRHYRGVAEERGCHFLDTSSVVRTSDLDGIHLEAGEQVKLGKAVAAKIREIYGPVTI